jgi:hypothetical protein
MAYLETYTAYAKYHDDSKNQEWTGLSKGQAKWRYHWLARQAKQSMDWPKERGWQRDWAA